MSKMILIGIGILIVVYIIVLSDRLIGAPSITITNPRESTTMINVPVIRITGLIQNNKDAVTINEISIAVKDNGEFEKDILLENGVNNFTVRAKRLLGREVVKTFTVIYEPAPPPPEGPPPTNERMKKSEKSV